jgi:predicted CXXCH cytochrome family protein
MRGVISQQGISKGLVFLLLIGLFCLLPKAWGDNQSADPHQKVLCGDCHALLADTDEQAQPSKMDPQKCRDCHLQNGIDPTADKSVSFHTDADRKCPDCHSFHNKEVIRAGERQFTFDFKRPERLFQCRTCHDKANRLDHLSEGHKAAAAVYHTDDPSLVLLSPSETCLSCHSKSVTSPGIANIVANCPRPPRFNEQASHRFGIAMRSGMIGARGDIRSDTDSRIPLKDGKIECQSCHEFTSGQKFQLRILGDSKDLCLGCHNFLEKTELRPMAN